MKKLILWVAVLFTFYSLTFAQGKEKSEPDKRWEVGLNAGVANFSGEYGMYKTKFSHNNSWDSDGNFGFGVFVKKNISYVFSLEGELTNASLSGAVYDFKSKPFKTAPSSSPQRASTHCSSKSLPTPC